MTAKISCVVVDGVTIGHPCCGIHNCKIPLASQRHRFCPEHEAQNHLCSIVNCDRPIVPETLACDDPAHQEVWKHHTARGQSRFTLHACLERARKAGAATAMATGGDSEDLEDLEAAEVDFLLDDDGKVVNEEVSEACPDKPPTGNRRIRAQFGRRRTHNEQIIVAPCGVIIACATFYGAEALHTVAVSAL